MPLPGDQYRDTPATVNPFSDNKPHINEFTATEIATLQSRLDKQLGPEYISTRPGAGGGKVHYLAAEKVINLANEVFGFNGWSSSIQNVQIDFVDEHPQNGKITLGLSTIVRVTLRDGAFHEDIGYGHIENCKGKAAAFEKAKKEAATDALKRALRNFGNVLGNCLYDKDYLQKVTKVKVAPSKWDAENLHRHPDYAPIKKESIEDAGAPAMETGAAIRRNISMQSGASYGSADFEDDFGGNPFDETDFHHADDVRVDDTIVSGVTGPTHYAPGALQHNDQQHGVPRTHSMPQLRPPNAQPPQAPQAAHNIQQPQRPPGVHQPPNNLEQAQPHRTLAPQQQTTPQTVLQQQQPATDPTVQTHTDARSNHSSANAVDDTPAQHLQQQQKRNASTTGRPSDQNSAEHGLPIPRMPPPGVPTGFVTGRSAALLEQPADARPPNAVLAFNPHADSPSIRRTHGVNPGKSAPVSRKQLDGTDGSRPTSPGPHMHGPVGGGNSAVTPVRTNFVNPAADATRRIGMPPGVIIGQQNRGAFRAPSAVGLKRPPLSDVSNLNSVQHTDGALDAKRAKTEDGGGAEREGQGVVVVPAVS